MDTVFSVHHDTSVLRDKNASLEQKPHSDRMTTAVTSETPNSTDADASSAKVTPVRGDRQSPAELRGIFQSLGGRFARSPVPSPQASPPTSRPETPSNEHSQEETAARAAFRNALTARTPFADLHLVPDRGGLTLPIPGSDSNSNSGSGSSEATNTNTHSATSTYESSRTRDTGHSVMLATPQPRGYFVDPVNVYNTKRALPGVGFMDDFLTRRPSSPWNAIQRQSEETITVAVTAPTSNTTKSENDTAKVVARNE